MSATLHAAIKRSMNSRQGEWGLVNGQLVHFGRRVRQSNGSYITDDTRIDRFVKHTFLRGVGRSEAS